MSISCGGCIRRLLGNILVLTLGGLAVKAVSLVLIPLYTTAPTADECGTAELPNSAIEIVLSPLSPGVVEALYWFSIDGDVPKDELFADSLVVLGNGVVCTGVVCALSSVLQNMEHVIAFFALFYSACIFKATTQLVCGLGHMRRFVTYRLINAFAMVVSTYLFLIRAYTDIEGYLWSYTIGYLVGGLAALLGSIEYRLLAPFRLDRVLLRRMLVYSPPPMPNLLSWWLVSVSGRYVVLQGNDLAAAGPFTAASRVPLPINTVASVFQQAWWYSTAREINSPDHGTFFGFVLRGYSLATLSTAGLVIALNRPTSRVILQTEFAEGWRYVPLFMLAVTFGAMTIFFSTFYQALVNSRMFMVSAVVGTVANVVLGVALVPLMGPWGVGLAGVVAYAFVPVVRVQDLRRRIDLPMGRSCLTYQFALFSITSVYTPFDGDAWLNGAAWARLILLATNDMLVLGSGARAMAGVFASRFGRR